MATTSAQPATTTQQSQTSTRASTKTKVTTTSGSNPTTSTTTTQTTPTTTIATTTKQTTTTSTTYESWDKPKQPNTPLQNKMNTEENRQRIKSVTTINEEKAGDGGYSDFDLKVTADTQMERIDPAEHGTVDGEPFFLVYADGSLHNGSKFTRTEGSLIDRSDVSQDTNGEYTLSINPAALKQTGVEDGKVRFMILLMDKDTDWDDIYGVRFVTINYSSSE